MVYCPATEDGTYPVTELGKNATRSCEKGYTGIMERPCISNGTAQEWGKEENKCSIIINKN